MFKDKQSPPRNNNMSHLLEAHFTFLKDSFVLLFQHTDFHQVSESQCNC